MKKALALLLCVALAVTSLVTAFAAEPTFECTVSDTDVEMGDTFTVTVSISGYEPIRGGALRFFLNEDVFEVISGEWLIQNTTLAQFDPNFLTATFASLNFQAQDINGDIFLLTLQAKEDMSSVGSMDIRVEPQLTNADNENVAEGVSDTVSVAISCAEHQYGDLVPEIPAKCGVEGRKAYYECSVCHKLFDENRNEITEAELVIPALTHVAEAGWHSDRENHWKICVNDGCGQVIDGTTASHNFEWVVDTPATEDAPGVQHEECAVCGYTRNENTEIPQLPHVHTGITHHEAVEATCHSTGTVEYWTCSSDKCAGKYYGNAECTTELASITTPVNPDNHAGGTEVRNAVEATCSENGYTGDTYCLGCGEKIADGTLISATGNHTDDNGQWESDGADHWHTCGACGTTFDQAAHEGGEATCSAKAACETCGTEYGELDPDNHVNTEIRGAVAATEESEGYTGDTWCLDCETMIAEGTVVPKLDHTHDMVKTEAKPATHEEDGNIEYYTCSKCGKLYRDSEGALEITLADTVVKATGHTFSEEYQSDENEHWKECDCGERTDVAAHSFGDWTVTKEATETADGSRERECSVCGYTQTEVIPATGSSEEPENPSSQQDDTSSEAPNMTLPGQNDESSQAGKPSSAQGDSQSPQTGDTSNMMVWLLLAASCGGVLTVFAVTKKRRAHR